MPFLSSSRMAMLCSFDIFSDISCAGMPRYNKTHQQCMAFSMDASSIKGIEVDTESPMYSSTRFELFEVLFTERICHSALVLRLQLRILTGISEPVFDCW